MKVIAINSSPRMDKGNTAKILSPFIEGMKEAGAEVEVFYTKKLDINPCQGEVYCQNTKPGSCFQKDDMQILLPKLRDAEIYVFTSPLYVWGFNGPMKNLIDRMFPLTTAYGKIEKPIISPKLRENVRLKKIVLISSCGWWSHATFDLLVSFMEKFCAELQVDFAGALLRPHAYAMDDLPDKGISVDDIFMATKEAGRQLIDKGIIDPRLLKMISRDLLPFEEYIQGDQ